MMGNINLLNGNYVKAKEMYRHGLKSAPQPVMEAHILNNLAFASWMHLIELPNNADADSKQQAQKDESYVVQYLKQSIELTEKSSTLAADPQKLRDLLAVDFKVDEKLLTEEEEQQYFGLLQGFGSGKAITNLCEYLLMTQAMKGEIRVSVLTHFSFRLLRFGSAADLSTSNA